MGTFKEGALTFEFPNDHLSSQYDEWSFYRKQFCKYLKDKKAVDFLFVDQDTLWLIEVKDYRQHQRIKSIDLADEIAQKACDSLTGLAAAQCNANDSEEKQLARKALSKRQIRVVLHLEQPKTDSRLFPQPINESNLRVKLKQRLKPIDAHPRILNKNTTQGQYVWRVC